MMLPFLIALAAGSPAPQEQATIQTCEMTPEGWLCRYRVPGTQPFPPSVGNRPAVVSPPTLSAPVPSTAAEAAQMDREARLILRCADAGWLSLCTQAEKREAKALREAKQAREALRREVTTLLSENKCADAVRTALAGGDMALARETRAFCEPATAGTPPTP